MTRAITSRTVVLHKAETVEDRDHIVAQYVSSWHSNHLVTA